MPRPPGPPFAPAVRSQRLEVEAGSATVALALQPRLPEINRRRLVPVMERVLREACADGRQVRIERLRVDLGEVPLGALEAELPRLLERELRRAVAAALRGEDAEARVRARPPGQARAELLERHLLRGTLPFWAPPGTTLRSLVDDMARAEPGVLAETVRRLGGDPRVLERLAAQLGDAALARLVRVLEPEHAALVLAYVLDLRRVHRHAPLLPLSERRFRRVLWIVVHAYLVRDPGTEFNRRAFVRSLLRGLARGQGLDYAALLATLRRGLERTRRHRAARSSLPAVVGELLREAGMAPGDSTRPAPSRPARQAGPDRARRVADPGSADGMGPFPPADGAEPGPVDGPEPGRGDAEPAGGLDAPGAPAVDRGLPRDADPLRAAGDAHPVDGAHAGRADAFQPGRPAASPAPRADAAPGPVDAIGGAGGLDATRPQVRAPGPVDADGAAEEPGHPRPGAGDPGPVDALGALRADVDPGAMDAAGGAGERAARRADADVPGPVDAAGGAVAGEAADPAGSRRARDGASASPTRADAARARGRRGGGDPPSPELAAYEAADALAYLLRHGVLPWAALLRDPAPDEGRLLSALPELPPPLLRRVLRARNAGERRRMTATLARGLGEDELARLLPRVLPALQGGPFREALRAFARAAADRRAFLARVLGAALAGEALDLEALAAGAGGMDAVAPAAPAAWPAHLLRSVLTDALRAGPAREREHPTPAALLDALAAHPADARYYLRALSRRPELAAALARSVPAPAHDRLLDRLYPDAAPAARALHAALAALPAPRRAADGRVRQVVLLEVMRAAQGQSPGVPFFARVLARLFGPRLPDAVGEHLLAAADAWARPGSLPAPHAAAFRAAVHAGLGETRGTGAAPADAAAAPRRAPDAPPVPRDAVFAFLLGRGPRTPSASPAGAGSGAGERGPPAAAVLSPDALRHALEGMLDEAPGEIVPFLRRHSADRRVRERWVRVLPERALARLAHLLEPHRHDTLLRTAEMLDAAWHEAAPAGFSARHGRRRFWGFLLRFLARNAGADRLTDRLVAAFFTDRAARCRRLSPVPDLPAIGARLLEAAGRVAATRGHARLHAALHRQRGRLLARWAPDAAGAHPRAGAPGPRRASRAGPPHPRPPRRPPAFRLGAPDAGDDGEPVYVQNAGLVLVSPFLPRLFGSLGLLVDGEDGRPRFRDAEAGSRGVHLLQYLVDGSTSTPEPALALNKVLCGVPLATPVDASIRMTEAEAATCGQLLAAVLANWPGMDGTSVQGLRETFLRREGRLAAGEDRWKLAVQRRTLDVLVDQVPWSISIVLHRWMPMPLHVQW